MSEVIDSLVTELGFTADTKVIDKASKKLKALEKQSNEAAKATDELADKQDKLKESVLKTTQQEQKLRKEQKKLRAEIKAAKKPTDDQRKALTKVDKELEDAASSTQRYRNELKLLGIQQSKIARQSRKEAAEIRRLSKARGGAQQRMGAGAAGRGRLAAGQQRRAAGQASAFAAETRSSASQTAAFFKQKQARETAASAAAGPGGLAGVAAGMAPVAAAAAGVVAVAGTAAAAIGAVVRTGAEMESLRARLKTVEGSVVAAGEAFTLLKGIAKETPFELQDVTNAYVRLKSLGIQPTEESLKSFGNIAAAQGKPLIDFVEAVGDAATGEFERLKEFGIKASSQGDQVAFTFAGMTTRVGKNAKEITKFLEGLGQNQFAGAMEDQMNTFNGVLSNLKDSWTTFLDEIAKLGVLDEAKLLLKELSGTMGDELVPIIADVLIGLLQWVRETFVDLRDSGGGLNATLEGIVNVVNVLSTALYPFVAIWKVLVVAFNLLIQAGGLLWGLLNNIFETLMRLLEPLGKLVPEFEGLGKAWETAQGFGASLLSVVDKVTGGLFAQAEAIEVVKGSLADLQKQALISALGGTDLTQMSDADLTKLQQQGGKIGTEAEKEVSKRIKAREDSEKKEDAAKRKDASEAKKKGRAGDIAKDFDQLNDRQLSAFASDPTVSKKLRDKAEKEQAKRAKKNKKKGAAAGKKMRDATLVRDVEKQIDKIARELAQAEAARGLRSGKLTAATAGGFETQRFKEIRDKQLDQFRTSGKLPAGIAQDIRQVAALPSINDLGGRTQAPVISSTINKFEISGNEFNAVVEGGTFEGTPQGFARATLVEQRRGLQLLLGESVDNFASNEIR